MATIYYKTEKTSETGKKMQSLIDKGKNIKKLIKAFLVEIGASNYGTRSYCAFGTGITAIEFKEEPNMKTYKKFKDFEGYYQPRMSSTEGRIINEKMTNFEVISRDEINEVIDFNSFLQHCGYAISKKNNCFGFCIDSEWKHTMPTDCVEVTYTEYNNTFNKNDSGTDQN